MELYSSHTCFCFISPSLSISWRHSSASLSLLLQPARNPTNQGERQLMLDRQSSPGGLVFRETAGCCNKPYRPLVPWWTGSRLSREVTVQVSEQATSQTIGSPAASTSISSRRFIPRRAIPKLLYEPESQPVACSRTVTTFNRRLPARQSRKGL